MGASCVQAVCSYQTAITEISLDIFQYIGEMGWVRSWRSRDQFKNYNLRDGWEERCPGRDCFNCSRVFVSTTRSAVLQLRSVLLTSSGIVYYQGRSVISGISVRRSLWRTEEISRDAIGNSKYSVFPEDNFLRNNKDFLHDSWLRHVRESEERRRWDDCTISGHHPLPSL